MVRLALFFSFLAILLSPLPGFSGLLDQKKEASSEVGTAEKSNRDETVKEDSPPPKKKKKKKTSGKKAKASKKKPSAQKKKEEKPVDDAHQEKTVEAV